MNLINFIDLTSLNESDTLESVTDLFKKADSPIGSVAAVCVNPEFVKVACKYFKDSTVKVATVANFPSGDEPIESVIKQIEKAIKDGADEVDVVFPYLHYMAGEKDYARKFIAACKSAAEDIQLKVILETGAFDDMDDIVDASCEAIQAGADFIKTSTGKIKVGATLEAARAMLIVIKELSPSLNHSVGLKVSGGIRDVEIANHYIALAEEIMGKEWVTPETFRIGASRLVDELM